MKKMNKKGFTLIELLAVIIILGVLLLIAVPSVSKYIQQSREKTYATNLSKLVDAVSTEVNSYSSDFMFNTNEYLVVPIVCLDLERGSSEKSPFSPYQPKHSFVVVTRNASNGFEYRVAALDQTGFGTGLSLPDDVKIGSMDVSKMDSISVGETTASFTAGNYTYLTGLTGLTAKVATPGDSDSVKTCLNKLK